MIITKQNARDILSTAIEGGTSYWSRIGSMWRVKEGTDVPFSYKTKGNFEYSAASFIDVEDPEYNYEEPKEVKITDEDIIKWCEGNDAEIERMLKANFATLESGNFLLVDAVGSDVIIQTIMFGKIIYG